MEEAEELYRAMKREGETSRSKKMGRGGGEEEVAGELKV